MPNRVVVTGVGVISPIGTGKDKFWNALTSGQSGIGQITRFDASEFPTRIAGEVDDFDPADYLDFKEVRRMVRFCHFAVAASGMAFADARLEPETLVAERAGTIIGSGIGGIQVLESQQAVLVKEGPRRLSPFLVPMMIANMAAGHTSIRYGLKGPNMCIVTACATGTHSIGEAFRVIKTGLADVMVAGGSEAAITPLGVGGFCAAKTLSTRNDEPERASRPFDKDRDGFVISEGCGILLLEEAGQAEARGADIIAEIVGYGATADAYHMTTPDLDGSGASRAMKLALKEAGLKAADIDYINAHGTSTAYNDRIETMAIKTVFGKHASEVAISANKSMIGHLLGAAGGVEGVATALSVRTGVIPPTINYETPDPDCDLAYTPNKSARKPIRAALSNSFGFGGQNAVLCFARYD
ncbi:MAG: beta-ketoacyl-ACP synthase II [Actinomycetota bacterium]